MGGASYYITDKKVKKIELPLSQEELSIIGLHTSSKKGAPSLQKLYEETPKKTEELIKQKAYESMMKYKVLSEQLESPLSEQYLEMYKQAKEIYEKLGGEEKTVVRLFRV